MKSLFEQMGGSYKQVGDYLLPDVDLPEEKPLSQKVYAILPTAENPTNIRNLPLLQVANS